MSNPLFVTTFDSLVLTGTANKKFNEYGNDTSRWANRSYIVGGGTDKVDYDLLAATSRVPDKYSQSIKLIYPSGGANAVYELIEAKGGISGTLIGKDASGTAVSCTARMTQCGMTSSVGVDKDLYMTMRVVFDLITVWA